MKRIKHYIKLLCSRKYWTWSNFKGVVQAYFRKTKYEYMGYKVPKHIHEQYMWREIKAKKCIDNITCLNCDCYIKERILEDRGCSIMEGKGNLVGKQEPCYPDLMKREVWNNYKTNNKIKI
jgi:hypothetical protein